MQPILVSKKVAAELLGISVGMLEKLVRRRQLDPVRIGRRTLFRRQDLEQLALPRSRRRMLDNVDPSAPTQ